MNIPLIYQSGKFQIRHFKEVNSTNDLAWNLISNNNPNKNVVIIADNQTKGKGQYGRTWEAKEGKNITMTAIIAPNELHIKHAFHLNIITSLAIIKALRSLIEIDLKVKWPNDIYHHNKKLCGILIKNKVINNHITHSIIGMGINVNQENFSPNSPNPTSLKNILKKTFDVRTIVEIVLDQLDLIIEKVEKEGIKKSCEEYNLRLFRKGDFHKFLLNEEEKSLNIQKVVPAGNIHLKTTSDEDVVVSSGLSYIL